MDICKVKYNIENYTVTGIKRGLTENDIMRYYSNLGYNVSKRYINYIKYGVKPRGILKKLVVPDKVKDIFNKYASGFPDIIMFKNDIIKFVEIKLDHDSLRPNQIVVLNELAEVVDTSVCYFNNLEILNKEDFNGINSFSIKQKVILKQLELFSDLAKKQDNKPFWIVSMLYERFGNDILNKKVLGLISDNINESKDKIIWFIDTNLKHNETKLRKEYKRGKTKQKTIRKAS